MPNIPTWKHTLDVICIIKLKTNKIKNKRNLNKGKPQLDALQKALAEATQLCVVMPSLRCCCFVFVCDTKYRSSTLTSNAAIMTHQHSMQYMPALYRVGQKLALQNTADLCLGSARTAGPFKQQWPTVTFIWHHFWGWPLANFSTSHTFPETRVMGLSDGIHFTILLSLC